MISIQALLFPLIFTIILSFILLHLLVKKNFLLDQINSSKHKQLTTNNSTNKPILCGGIIIFIGIFFFDTDLFQIQIISFFVLIIGTLSDINKLNSPKYRILFQFLIVFLFLLFNGNLAIVDLRVAFINNILSIKFIAILFSIFCMLILINGSNFLDGLNTLVAGYYILVLTIIVLTSSQFNLYIDLNIYYLIITISVVFIFNFFNKIYLGDAGSYLISFLTAFFILDFYSQNNSVSPYFICLLLWYPAFENLFSILRRITSKKNIDKADDDHLHQMIYRLLIYKNYLNKRYTNTATAMLINLFNLLIFIFAYKYYFFTEYLILIIFFNITVYLLLYFFIKKNFNYLS
tara:strand:+ start:694 stop:1737 length:1044 start_codon:yes stop_codon:yes gene_type:complete